MRPRQRRSAKGDSDGIVTIVIFVILIGALIYAGWRLRRDDLINPEHGLGYALGVVGASMMLALLLYPLRKRLKVMRGWGRVAFWFRLHMLLGVLGPALVLLHSDFHIRSLNAAVAFYSMLIVAGSGVIGRYFYGRIHRGLYGGRLEARELIAEAQSFRFELANDLRAAAWKAEFADLEREAMRHARSFFSAVAQAISLNAHANATAHAFRRDFEEDMDERANEEGWSNTQRRRLLAEGRRRISRYRAGIRRVGALAVYERLFAAWHILHLPLFLMLILTAVIHVVAVHVY
jgi:hypothetical protein